MRHWDAERSELTLWAVVHGHAEGVGGWFAHCAPGDRLAIWGPRHGFWSDDAYASTTGGRHHLFVTDESGFAAVAALLDRLLPADTRHVLAETIDADQRSRSRVGGPTCAGRTGARSCRASATGWSSSSADMPAAPPQERSPPRSVPASSRQITEIRRYLRHEIGLPATAVSMTGYWRRAAS